MNTNPLTVVNEQMDELKAAILAATDGVVVGHCQGRMFIDAKASDKSAARAALKVAVSAAGAFAAAAHPGRFKYTRHRRRRYWWTYVGRIPHRLRCGVQANMTREEESAVLRGMR
jgi:hypothetical protein